MTLFSSFMFIAEIAPKPYESRVTQAIRNITMED